MICGYENIYDLCNNQYYYQYSSFINNGKYVIVNSDINAPVIRTDKVTGQKLLLTSTDLIPIDTCDNITESDIISVWDCYLIYRQNEKPIDNPSLNEYKNAQKQYINDQYNNLLNNGILITINNFVISTTITSGSGSGSSSVENTISFSIRLPSKPTDQIYYSNLSSFLNLWYATNSNAKIPRIIDFYDRSYELSYINLNRIFVSYFRKLKEYLDIKNDLLDIIDNASSIEDISRAIFYTSRQISGSSSGTTIT
jgi:hypothetical protein